MRDQVFVGTIVLPGRVIEFPFRVLQTFVRGACVASEERVPAEPGAGTFVSPLRPQRLAA